MYATTVMYLRVADTASAMESECRRFCGVRMRGRVQVQKGRTREPGCSGLCVMSVICVTARAVGTGPRCFALLRTAGPMTQTMTVGADPVGFASSGRSPMND